MADPNIVNNSTGCPHVQKARPRARKGACTYCGTPPTEEDPDTHMRARQTEELVEHPQPATPLDNLSTVRALLERVARDAGADLKKLDRLIAMYERLKGKEAELAYNAAKGRILKKLAGIKIVKNRSVVREIEKGNPRRGAYEAFK